MKNLIFILSLFFFSCGENTVPHAKQIGLQDIDITSIWVYQTTVYFDSGDSTKFTQTHTVIDDAVINNLPGYLVQVETPFGDYDYIARTDSSGTYIERNGVLYHYKYPSLDTFSITSGCGTSTVIANTDTSFYSYDNLIMYHTWQQPCNTSDTYAYYKYGIGLVGYYSASQNQITKQILLSYQP